MRVKDLERKEREWGEREMKKKERRKVKHMNGFKV
jgi:hypothetical protein